MYIPFLRNFFWATFAVHHVSAQHCILMSIIILLRAYICSIFSAVFFKSQGCVSYLSASQTWVHITGTSVSQWGSPISISKTFLGYINAAGLGATLWEPLSASLLFPPPQSSSWCLLLSLNVLSSGNPSLTSVLLKLLVVLKCQCV